MTIIQSGGRAILKRQPLIIDRRGLCPKFPWAVRRFVDVVVISTSTPGTPAAPTTASFAPRVFDGKTRLKFELFMTTLGNGTNGAQSEVRCDGVKIFSCIFGSNTTAGYGYDASTIPVYYSPTYGSHTFSIAGWEPSPNLSQITIVAYMLEG